MKSIPVTVVVPVKNEERTLSRCLAPLARFSEVIVVNSASTDATPKVARDFGAKLLQFEWNGRYPKKRNWVLLNHELSTKWVLFLDADEIVNERFCDEVDASIFTNRHNGFWLNYTNYFLGRRLDHGVPQQKLALFAIGRGLYERIDEISWSPLDMEIHEHPMIEGSVGSIKTPIEHRDCGGIGKFLDRHRDYAAWEARRRLLLERQKEIDSKALTRRQRLKYQNIEKWWYPWVYFAYAYVVKFGFLDGAAGFYYAFYKSWYFLSIRLMIKEFREGIK